MKEIKTEPCGIPLETFLRVGPVTLNPLLPPPAEELVFQAIFMYSICRIRFSTQMYSSWRTVLLLTFSPSGIKSCPSSGMKIHPYHWNWSLLTQVGRVPLVPLKFYFAYLSREPVPCQDVLHSALWGVLGALQTVFWKSSKHSKHLTYLSDIPQSRC